MRLKYNNFILGIGRVPESPAAADLAWRAFEIIYPDSGIRIVFLAGLNTVGDRLAVR